ncbi:hypothetical protein CKO25_13895 [Thiocapsa imhoffii]|uniref:Phospholipid/glycerol acyltransferase domain-containing protein n=1 Tax=Thiocapsa imhoffii TaxID=382777 RepID=A0A9X1B9C9_9GAMM|nr:lysophospholipid acyltransferase family protein [Thiocapsa imhoffii]MBK1645722.1 hypothetical protein [Thiocapsa imhoffii]
MRGLVAVRRAALLMLHLGSGALLSLPLSILSTLLGKPLRTPALVRWWHRRLCHLLAIRIRVSGQPRRGALLVGNHVSWLDIPVIGTHVEAHFLAKREVRDWPLIGWLAATAGTAFIDRGAHHALTVAAALRERIQEGQTLMVFPEGTTTDGTRVQRFHPRLFALAQDGTIPIQPVAIAYRDPETRQLNPLAPFLGEDDLFAHLTRLVTQHQVHVEVQFLTPFHAPAQARRADLANRAHQSITAALHAAAGSAHQAPGPPTSQTASPAVAVVVGEHHAGAAHAT